MHIFSPKNLLKIAFIAFLVSAFLIQSFNVIAFKETSFLLLDNAKKEDCKYFVQPICEKAKKNNDTATLKLCTQIKEVVNSFPNSWLETKPTDLVAYNNFKNLENLIAIQYLVSKYTKIKVNQPERSF